MRKDSLVLMSLLGAAVGEISFAEQGKEYRYDHIDVSEETKKIVQKMSDVDAFYYNTSLERVMIQAKRLPSDVLRGLLLSNEVDMDEETGDFVLNNKFAKVLAHLRVFSRLGTRSGYELNEKVVGGLKEKLEPVLREDLLAYSAAPFYR